MVTPAIWTMTLMKLGAVKKFVAVKLKKAMIATSPAMTGRTPRLPDLTLSRIRCPSPGCSSGASPAGRLDARSHDIGFGAHDAPSTAVSAMPETFVGTPAVIAWTTSCWVVVSRS